RRAAFPVFALAIADVLLLSACEFLLPLQEPNGGSADGGLGGEDGPTGTPMIKCGEMSCPTTDASGCCRDTHGHSSCVASREQCTDAGGVLMMQCNAPGDCPLLAPCCASPDKTWLRCGADCNPDAGNRFVCYPDGAPVDECKEPCQPNQVADGTYRSLCP